MGVSENASILSLTILSIMFFKPMVYWDDLGLDPVTAWDDWKNEPPGMSVHFAKWKPWPHGTLKKIIYMYNLYMYIHVQVCVYIYIICIHLHIYIYIYKVRIWK